MSNKNQAIAIYREFKDSKSRSDMITLIQKSTGVGSAYASTLYQQAKKTVEADGMTSPAVQRTKPTAPKKGSATTISTFDSRNLDQVRDAIEAKLREVEAEFGINLKTGNIRYSDNSFRMGIEATTGNPEDAAREKWNAYCFRIGMKREDFGKTFRSPGSGEVFRITGYLTKGKKYQVRAENVANGKSYKFPGSTVRSNLIEG